MRAVRIFESKFASEMDADTSILGSECAQRSKQELGNLRFQSVTSSSRARRAMLVRREVA